MLTPVNNKIAIMAVINAPVETVWNFWTSPVHIIHWNNASDEWHTSYVENDLKTGGRFLSRMEAKDGSAGFDFSGEYTSIEHHHKIVSLLDDGRSLEVILIPSGNETIVHVSSDRIFGSVKIYDPAPSGDQ